jgi:hypothetical protein
MDKKAQARERARLWRLDNPEKVKENQRRWYLEHKNYVKKKVKKYRAENIDKIQAQKLQARANNPAKHILDMKRSECRKFGVEFSVSLSDITPLPKFCPVLGIELDYMVAGRPADHSPSLDRTNNDLGYVHGNVRIISNRANRIKSDGTLEEHIKIVNYMKGTNAREHSTTQTPSDF